MKSSPAQRAIRPAILNGWKEIASHLGKGIRTVQRYDRELRLPVHRPGGKTGGAVMSTKAELDAWVAATPIREACRASQTQDLTPTLADLKRHLGRMRKLGSEMEELRAATSAALRLLHENLQLLRAESLESFSKRYLRGDVLGFDSKKIN